jgi:hypothetical protein
MPDVSTDQIATEDSESRSPDVPGEYPARTFDIEEVGKGIAYAAATCYVAGLLVVNFYLFRLGFSDFSLLRTRFILTGAIALLPGIVASLLVHATVVAAFEAGDASEVESTKPWHPRNLLKLVVPDIRTTSLTALLSLVGISFFYLILSVSNFDISNLIENFLRF